MPKYEMLADWAELAPGAECELQLKAEPQESRVRAVFAGWQFTEAGEPVALFHVHGRLNQAASVFSHADWDLWRVSG